MSSETPAPVELGEGVLKRVQVVVEHGAGHIEVVYGRVQRQRLQGQAAVPLHRGVDDQFDALDLAPA